MRKHTKCKIWPLANPVYFCYCIRTQSILEFTSSVRSQLIFQSTSSVKMWSSVISGRSYVIMKTFVHYIHYELLVMRPAVIFSDLIAPTTFHNLTNNLHLIKRFMMHFFVNTSKQGRKAKELLRSGNKTIIISTLRNSREYFKGIFFI